MATGTSTYFILVAEYGSGMIELERICAKYFGICPEKAKRLAVLRRLPIPAIRGGSQKSPWLVSAAHLADWIDEQVEKGRADWEKSRTGTGHP